MSEFSQSKKYPNALYMRRSRTRKKIAAKHPGAVISPAEVLVVIEGDAFGIYSTDTGQKLAYGRLAENPLADRSST